ncbi:MAG: hypothetical protein A2W22_03865 [Candidatus Levybacteria bacterium RBG_16_35_11]|nr:MAG: hypothetical protein A2W22_03865 [Candidatus Levybacteria bacterium RBG_16_35_11]
MKRIFWENIYLWPILLFYSFLMLLVIDWGIPNVNHPFNYHMDEWHQMQAVRDLFKYGTNNMEGAAHGPVLQFFLGGIFLVPFILIRYIDPFSISSSLQNLVMQERIFEVLRLNTLLFGVTSIIVLWKTIKDNFNISPLIPVLLFTFSPIWLSLSNYFKYDIALIFWILLAVWAMLNYHKRPILKNFLFASFFSGLALSAKASAVPIFPILIFSYFLFSKGIRKNITGLILGIAIFFVTFTTLGIPDLLFLKKGDYFVYFYDNLVTSPTASNDFILGAPWYIYILFTHYPLIFGIVLYLFSLVSIFFLIYKKLLNSRNKTAIFILVSLFFFSLSLLALRLELRGNRSLVLLPFLILSITFFLQEIKRIKKIPAYALITFLVAVQVIQSVPYVLFKTQLDTKQVSSEWITKNINKGLTIGLQPVPIYQGIPDFLLKDYYFGQKQTGYYRYKLVDYKTKELPDIILLTNTNYNKNLINNKDEIKLLERLSKEGYKLQNEFIPNLNFFFSDFNNILFSGLFPVTDISIYKK